MRRNNFGFAKLEHLAGNVGHLDLRGFNEAGWAGRTAIAAIPVDQDSFVLDEYDFFVLEVETDNEGNPTALVGHYRDGRTDRTLRTE